MRVTASRAENALDFLRVAAGYGFAPEDVEYLYIKEGIPSAPVARERKELDAFLRLKRYMYYSLLRHEPSELLTGYDVSFPECHASTVLPLEDGRMLCVYFAGSHEGADDVGIWLSARENGAWRRPRRIAKVNDTAHWNPVIFAADDGIRVVFRVGRTIPGWVSYTMTSADGGETWVGAHAAGRGQSRGRPRAQQADPAGGRRMLAPNSDESAEAWLPRVDESTDGGVRSAGSAPIPLNRRTKLRRTSCPASARFSRRYGKARRDGFTRFCARRPGASTVPIRRTEAARGRRRIRRSFPTTIAASTLRSTGTRCIWR